MEIADIMRAFRRIAKDGSMWELRNGSVKLRWRDRVVDYRRKWFDGNWVPSVPRRHDLWSVLPQHGYQTISSLRDKSLNDNTADP